MDKKKIIIDTDTASDDAVALVMALRDPGIEVVAITTVAGNVDVETATHNALLSVEYASSYKPPVFKGVSRPLVREAYDASYVHGKDGMGDLGTFRPPAQTAEEQDAVAAMIDIISRGGGDIEIVTLGPLTNIACAIAQAPDVMKKIPRITMMAGAAYKGNVSPTAEFNVWADPDAADIVCNFSVPFTMVTIEACWSCAVINEDDIRYLKGTNSEIAAFCVDCNTTMIELGKKGTGKPRFSLPDPTAIAILMHPDMATDVFNAYTRVETAGSQMTYGMTVHDRRDPSDSRAFCAKYETLRPFNSTIVAAMDEKKFKDYLFSLIVEEEKR